MTADTQGGWYDKQMGDDAVLGAAAAESKWHGRKRDPDAAAKRVLNASFDEIVAQFRACETRIPKRMADGGR
jgi:hypothetical protein